MLGVNHLADSLKRQIVLCIATVGFVWEPVFAQSLPDAGQVLLHYHEALQTHTIPVERRYHQETSVQGWQNTDQHTDFRWEGENRWKADVTYIDQSMQLDSTAMDLVEPALFNVLALGNASAGGTDVLGKPIGFIGATLDLDASPETYRVTGLDSTQLAGEPVYHLKLEPRADGPLRELWLDQKSRLPRRIKGQVAGFWGKALVFLTFRFVDERYWLPHEVQVEATIDYWVPFQRVTGFLTIDNHYSNYHLHSSDLPAAPLSRTAISPPNTSPQPRGSDRLLDKNGIPTLEVGVATQKSASSIADRIVEFNRRKPSITNTKGFADIFIRLKTPGTSVLEYLFRFDFRKLL